MKNSLNQISMNNLCLNLNKCLLLLINYIYFWMIVYINVKCDRIY